MKLVYGVNDKPPLKKNLVYAFQQLRAIMAATLLEIKSRSRNLQPHKRYKKNLPNKEFSQQTTEML